MKRTYNSMNNRMLAEHNNFSRSRDKPFPILSKALRLAHIRELIDDFVDGGDRMRADICDPFLYSLRNECACFHESEFEIFEKVGGVFNADAETDEVLGQAPCGARCRVD